MALQRNWVLVTALLIGGLGLTSVSVLSGLGVFSSIGTPVSPTLPAPPPPAAPVGSQYVQTELVMDSTVDEFDIESRERFRERLAEHLDIDVDNMLGWVS